MSAAVPDFLAVQISRTSTFTGPVAAQRPRGDSDSSICSRRALQLGPQRRNFLKQERALICFAQLAQHEIKPGGDRSLYPDRRVSPRLALQAACRNARTTNGLPARSPAPVDGARQQFFAGTGFAFDPHRSFRRCRLTPDRQAVPEGRTLADHVDEIHMPGDLALKPSDVIGPCPAPSAPGVWNAGCARASQACRENHAPRLKRHGDAFMIAISDKNDDRKFRPRRADKH